MKGVVWQNKFRIVKYLSVVNKNSFRLQPSFLRAKYFHFITHFLGILPVQFHCIRTKRNLPCCCSVWNRNKRCLLCFCYQFYFSPYGNNLLWICCEHYTEACSQTIHTTKIVSSPSNKIVIIQKNVCSVSVKVLIWAYFSRARKETEYSEWSRIQLLLFFFCVCEQSSGATGFRKGEM